MNFIDDFREILIKHCNALGITYSHKWSTRLLCVKFLDAKNRFCLSGEPKKISYSRELVRKIPILSQIEQKVLKDIERRLGNAQEIFPYLSKIIHETEINKSDFMLKNWGIFHAHLGEIRSGSKHSNRSDKLLFFTVKGDDVFFVDVKPHPHGHAWFDRDLLEIINCNWPGKILIELPGVEIYGAQWHDEDIFKSSKYCVVPVTINGKTICPCFGVSVSGDSIEAVDSANLFFQRLKKAEEELQQKTTFIHEKLLAYKKDGLLDSIPEKLEFKLVLCDKGYGALILGTPIIIPLGILNY